MARKLTTADYASLYIKRFGWELVPLEPMHKMTRRDGWGDNTLKTETAAADYYQNGHADWGIGVHLGKSQICSLDIDDADAFKMILDEYGLPTDEIDAAPTIQGKGKRIIFSVPDGLHLPYAKLNWPRKDDPTKRFTVFELRSATDGKHRLDVVPPTIHPDTKEPYRWIVQPPKTGKFPPPPQWLLAIWQAWEAFKPQFQDVCPWVTPQLPAKASKKAAVQHGEQVDVIAAYCSANPITQELELRGYTPKGKRYLSPHTGTGLPGVVLLDSDRCWIHHASDPLCSDESGRPVNAFDLFCYYDHNDDISAAIREAAKQLGIERKPRPIPAITEQTDTPEPMEPETTEAQENAPAWEFKCLGYNGARLYVLPRRSEQVVSLSAGALSKAALMQIASLEWWESAFGKDKGGCDWDMAINAVIRKCERVGIYDSRKERGRGAWYDDGKPVLHLGTSLVVDGQQTAISDHHSRYIYTKQARMENIFNAEPATDADTSKLLDIYKQLNWTRPEHGLMALGWTVLAPICGALPWRPHVWLTAQRGAGKSWIQSVIMKPLIGEETLIFCQGGTTEAGIRQALKHDARPVMFDEAESEDAGAARRMQSVLELARQASSDTGAEIVKGTATGDGMTFNIRSMFCMGSINVALRQAADESRFTVISLNKPPNVTGAAERFAAFEREVEATLTPAFCASIRARMYHAIPTLRENAKAFAQAVAEVVGSQRIGDQVGTLLAGAFAVQAVEPYTVEDCRTLISAMDFTEATEVDDVSDEHNCLNAILQRQVRVEFEMHGATNRTIGELVSIAHNNNTVGGISPSDAADVIGRHGVRVVGGELWIANAHSELSKTLRDTPWASGHRRLLLRIDGAKTGDKVGRFAGSASRYVSIPMHAID